jgi:hypothetical protein
VPSRAVANAPTFMPPRSHTVSPGRAHDKPVARSHGVESVPAPEVAPPGATYTATLAVRIADAGPGCTSGPVLFPQAAATHRATVRSPPHLEIEIPILPIPA